MKKKDLIAKIKKSALDEMPDIRHKINLSKINIQDEPEKVKTPFNFKRAVSYTFASIFILVSGVFGFLSISNITDTTPLETDTEIVGFQTISAASLLDSMNITELSNTIDENNISLLSSTTTVIEEDDAITNQLSLINGYLNLSETVLAEKNQYLYESIESDNPNYSYSYQYKGTDLAGNLILYKGYYNLETIQNSQVETGILIHEGKTFMYATVTIENGENTIYRYRVRIDENNYVEVYNASNDNIQKFNYRYFRNGELSHESEIVLLSNRKTIKAQIKITNRLNQELTLNVERDLEQTENQQFKVSYTYNRGLLQSEGEFTVGLQYNSETDSYNYQYNINSRQITVNDRPEKGNRPAIDDDFIRGRMDQNPYITTEFQNTTNQDTAPGSTNPGSTAGNYQNSGYRRGNDDSSLSYVKVDSL